MSIFKEMSTILFAFEISSVLMAFILQLDSKDSSDSHISSLDCLVLTDRGCLTRDVPHPLKTEEQLWLSGKCGVGVIAFENGDW